MTIDTGPDGIRRGLQASRAFFDVGQSYISSLLEGGTPAAPAAVLRQLFEKLGATYIKLGQFIASSPSLFPAEYVTEFQQLLDKTEAVPFSEVKATIASELDQPIDEVPSHSVAVVPLADRSYPSHASHHCSLPMHVRTLPINDTSDASMGTVDVPSSAGVGDQPCRCERPSRVKPCRCKRPSSDTHRVKPRRCERPSSGTHRVKPCRCKKPWSDTQPVLVQVFSFIDPTPLASASIAQVHAAELKASGKQVVLKVLKPGVESVLRTDLTFLAFAVKVLQTLNPELERTSVAGIVEDIRTSMLDEVLRCLP